MKIDFKIKRENIFCAFVLWIWIQTILLRYVRAIIMRLPIIGAYPDAVLMGVFVVLLFFNLPCFKLKKSDIIFLVFVNLIFIFEWIFYEEGHEFLDKYMIEFLLKTLPMYVVGVSLGKIKNRENIIKKMYYLSIITLLMSIIYRFLFGIAMDDITSKYVGNMDLAYKILPHCCLIAYYTIKKKNFLNIICTIIGGGYLLMLGTRGAVLIYIALILFLLTNGKNSIKLFLKLSFLCGGMLLFIKSPLYEKTLIFMYGKAQQYGLSIRIFDKLLSEKISDSSGRNIIAEKVLEAINEKMIFGNGLCSDRVIAGNYSHNIFLELWVEFGVFIGTGIVITIIIILFRGYKSARGKGEKGLILALIFSAFFKLMLSGTYLDEKLLFFLLGLCVYSIRKTKLKENIKFLKMR